MCEELSEDPIKQKLTSMSNAKDLKSKLGRGWAPRGADRVVWGVLMRSFRPYISKIAQAPCRASQEIMRQQLSRREVIMRQQ